MNKTYFKTLGNHEYGWYAYAEDDIFVLGDDYPHEGGELYRGEFKENIPYIDKFKRDCPEAYDNAVKYFNNMPKKTISEIERAAIEVVTKEQIHTILSNFAAIVSNEQPPQARYEKIVLLQDLDKAFKEVN